ncbi:MAG: hypothetical protein LBR56_00800, partial [Sporomusaceae bacterium]|nr:hypothetical protein [Sporomusaceae bacterium]
PFTRVFIQSRYGEIGTPALAANTDSSFDLTVLRGDSTVITDDNTIFTAPEDGIYSFYLKPQQYQKQAEAGFTTTINTSIICSNLVLTPVTGEPCIVYTGPSDSLVLQTISWIGRMNKGDKLRPSLYSGVNLNAEPLDAWFGGVFSVVQHAQL